MMLHKRLLVTTELKVSKLNIENTKFINIF